VFSKNIFPITAKSVTPLWQLLLTICPSGTRVRVDEMPSSLPWWTHRELFVAALLIGLTSILWVAYIWWQERIATSGHDRSEVEDPPVLKSHSTKRSFKTPFATYTALRTFYRPHAHTEKLQAIANLPLLVFMHGLGGSLSQFAPLLGSLVNVAPCFGLDMPGHGMSDFSPEDPDAYTSSAFRVLWRTAIEEYCEKNNHQKVVLIGHSYGSSIAASLAVDPRFKFQVAGLVAICPKAIPPSRAEAMKFRAFLSLPDRIIDAVRWFDQRGGLDSKSVSRFVGEGAGVDLRRLQLRFNQASKTPVWKRVALGAIPEYDAMGNAHGGICGSETWRTLRCPLFLVAGEADQVTKPLELAEIVASIAKPSAATGKSSSASIPTADSVGGSLSSITAPRSSDQTAGILPNLTTTKTPHSTILKTATLPAPAAHALLYDHRTYRTLAGLIEDFLSVHISSTLSLGWQLQHLTTSGKWDVKNLEKWQRTQAVSGPLADNLLRALKTLREQDESHTPAKFVAEWKDQIYAVIDISHDAPIYDTHTLEDGGIQYHKFPTVSKIPPTPVEVADFIALVDRLRAEMEASSNAHKAVAVHCHYGYNRTGFFCCSYLIERQNYGVQQALDAFREAKPPGIRHDHFVDALWVRYTVGLKRAPILKVEGSEG
jgi:pimeloyl-ACP methyl ester carboxylesterase/protein-tyrosine phosphatase